ncbi:MAG TPA: hypothetical protein VM537_26955 [Anaerolineae bacterium]|nr:hypothetical protein [Anaerolineae bacterium]
MPLNRRDFLKGLGITSLTIPFLRKLPAPPTPEPEPISLQEEYNERVEQEINNPLYLLAADPAWGNFSCSSDVPFFLWHDHYVWPSHEYPSLEAQNLSDLSCAYYHMLEGDFAWSHDELAGPILKHLRDLEQVLADPNEPLEYWDDDWWIRYRRTRSGRWALFSPFGYRILESPNRSET